jgi:hypothetical protein
MNVFILKYINTFIFFIFISGIIGIISGISPQLQKLNECDGDMVQIKHGEIWETKIILRFSNFSSACEFDVARIAPKSKTFITRTRVARERKRVTRQIPDIRLHIIRKSSENVFNFRRILYDLKSLISNNRSALAENLACQVENLKIFLTFYPVLYTLGKFSSQK